MDQYIIWKSFFELTSSWPLACKQVPTGGWGTRSAVLVHLWQTTNWKNWKNRFFHKNWFVHNSGWNWGGLEVSRVTARTVRKTAQQFFARFGLTWHRKVHFPTFSGKLTFQSTRNGCQNPPFCPGALQDTFMIYSSISHQHIFSKIICKKTTSREFKIWKFQKSILES